jgi:hypothetical protein
VDAVEVFEACRNLDVNIALIQKIGLVFNSYKPATQENDQTGMMRLPFLVEE